MSPLRHHNVLSQAFIDAAVDAGHARNDDFNADTQDGFGYYAVTQRNGARCSTAVAFLRPALARANLEVRTRALATRVVLDGGRAVGVAYRHRGRAERAEAGCVILAGGAINSPQLLMLSGIGPADHLREHGIAVALDRAGVGANLQDHLDICTLVRSTRAVTYDKTNDVAVALRFLLRRDGIGSSNIAEAGGFVRSRLAPDSRCDIQFHFVPALLDDHGRHRLEGHGYTVHACNLRPKSRGAIRLRSADPGAAAAIHPNYLGDEDGFDLRMMVEGARLSREILAQDAFAPYRGAEIFPGADAKSDADLAAARTAVAARDFEALADVSERSCLRMHALALSAEPGLVYWNGATVEALRRIRELRRAGCAAFFTIDAGPQLKAVCAPADATRVADALRDVAGVAQVLRSRLGAGARLIAAEPLRASA